jgi:hypothetical protein
MINSINTQNKNKYYMENVNQINKISFYLCGFGAVISFFAFIIGILDALRYPLHNTVLLYQPLIYTFFSIISCVKCKFVLNYHDLTLNIIQIFQIIRCVIIPVFGVMLGNYDELILTDSFSITAYLLIYEQIAVWLCCLWYRQKRYNYTTSKTIQKGQFVLQGTYVAYGIFILIAGIIYLYWGRNQQLFNFIVLDTSERVGDITDSGLVMVISIVTTALAIFSLVVIYLFFKKYYETKNSKYITWSILVAILMLCILVGERRSAQVYKLFSYSWLLICLFPMYKKKILFILITVAGTILALMTIYKSFYAFLYGSYIEAITNSSTGIAEYLNMFDSYFYGIKSVDKSINFIINNYIPFTQFFIDIFRNIFGIHYLFSKYKTITEIYNLYIYSGTQSAGYLFSSISYGYLMFGAILAPISTILNIVITMWLERIIRRIYCIEFLYIFALIYMRYCFGVFSSFSSLLNYASRTIIIFSIVIICSSLFRRKYNE